VISYASYDPEELENYRPRVVHVGDQNQILTVDENVSTLLRSPLAA
jgi:aspartate 1-decarboxylase